MAAACWLYFKFDCMQQTHLDYLLSSPLNAFVKPIYCTYEVITLKYFRCMQCCSINECQFFVYGGCGATANIFR